MNEEKKKLDVKEEFIKTLQDLEGVNEVEKMIKDNKIEFDIDNVKYRVRQPTMAEQRELETFRRKKTVEFMNDNTMLFQKDWIEKYKAKGIDIEDMDKQIREKHREINQLMLKLATTSETERVEELKQEILILRSEIAGINIERTDLLSYSIEDQLMVAVNSYYTYLVLEKLDNEKYIRVFASFEEFENSTNSKLINKAFTYVSGLIYTMGV